MIHLLCTFHKAPKNVHLIVVLKEEIIKVSRIQYLVTMNHPKVVDIFEFLNLSMHPGKPKS